MLLFSPQLPHREFALQRVCRGLLRIKALINGLAKIDPAVFFRVVKRKIRILVKAHLSVRLVGIGYFLNKDARAAVLSRLRDKS